MAGLLVLTNAVDVGYFDTMGIRLLHGRDFTDADRAGSVPVAVINDTMARNTGRLRIRSAAASASIPSAITVRSSAWSRR